VVGHVRIHALPSGRTTRWPWDIRLRQRGPRATWTRDGWTALRGGMPGARAALQARAWPSVTMRTNGTDADDYDKVADDAWPDGADWSAA
jgi:hypothetical protein